MLKGLTRQNGRAPQLFRPATGLILLAHGQQELFGDRDHGGSFLSYDGFPFRGIFATIPACSEFNARACSLHSPFTHSAAGLILIILGVVILLVHLANGLIGEAFEFPLSLSDMALGLMLLGPGKASIERTGQEGILGVQG